MSLTLRNTAQDKLDWVPIPATISIMTISSLTKALANTVWMSMFTAVHVRTRPELTIILACRFGCLFEQLDPLMHDPLSSNSHLLTLICF